MKVRVLFFAACRERAGTAETVMELPDGADVAALLEALERSHPALGRLAGAVAVAVDREIARPGTALREGCEAALLPPVSGG